MRDRISGRQLTALGFVALLSPLVRRFPQQLADHVGRTGWLAVPLAAAPLLLWLAGYRCLLRRGGGDWYALLQRCLGTFFGRLAAALSALWMVFYAGFLLRALAVRQMSTVYPDAGPGVFVLGMALAAAVAACGSLKAIARSAMVLRPLLVTVMLLVLALTLGNVDLGLLLPVTGRDLLPNGLAALRLSNSFAAVFLLAFLLGRTDGPPARRQLLGWGGALLGMGAAATVCCLGMFGPELTAQTGYPFFLLARDVTVLGSVERVEPLVVAASLFSDFILVSALLWMASRLALRLLGREEAPAKSPALLCAALAAATAFLFPGAREDWRFWSEDLVPVLSAAFTAGVPGIALAVGKLRGRL